MVRSRGRAQVVAHRIELKQGTHPLRQQPYRAGPNHRELIEEHVEKMFAAEVIELAQSDWDSHLFIEANKNGTLRFSVDYRKLNEGTVLD